jgi:hypothetical protein
MTNYHLHARFANVLQELENCHKINNSERLERRADCAASLVNRHRPLAYHNDPAIKDAILAQLRAHYEADEIIKGQYWENGKGCAVGCTLHSDDHSEYELRFGIPQILAHLKDSVFKGLPNSLSKEWPIRFMSAARVGSDLSCVGWQFLYRLVTDETVNPGINHPLVRDAVRQCSDVMLPLTKGEMVPDRAAENAAEKAARSAKNAKDAAWRTDESASWSAESAWNAARSVARIASINVSWSVVWSASKSVAWSAAESAARSVANSAADDARTDAYVAMSDKMIALMETAP